MEKFTGFTGLVAPLDRDDVDTDAIIPKQFMKSIARTGFGQNLFDSWRYLDAGEPGMDCGVRPLNPDFVLNQARYQGASILLARRNFGCGSSREHAPWALLQYGFRAIVASSFADIFKSNCYQNGLLPVTLDEVAVAALFQQTLTQAGFKLAVDLQRQVVCDSAGVPYPFAIAASTKAALIEGWDDISLTLRLRGEIAAFEQQRHARFPWLRQPIRL